MKKPRSFTSGLLLTAAFGVAAFAGIYTSEEATLRRIWKKNLSEMTQKSFDNASFETTMGVVSPLSFNAVPSKGFFFPTEEIELDDTTTIAYADLDSVLSRYSEFDSVCTTTSMGRSNVICMEGLSFATADLDALNRKVKAFTQQLQLPEAKILLESNNASMAAYCPSASPLGKRYPNKTVILLNNGMFRRYARPSIEAAAAHETGHRHAIKAEHAALIKIAKNASYSPRQKKLKSQIIRQFYEFHSDSIGFVLMKYDTDAFLPLLTEFNYEAESYLRKKSALPFSEKSTTDLQFESDLVHELKEQRGFENNPFKTHPTPASRIFNLFVIGALHDIADPKHRKALQSLLPRPPHLGD